MDKYIYEKRERKIYIEREEIHISAQLVRHERTEIVEEHTDRAKNNTQKYTHTKNIWKKNTHEYQPRLYVKRIRSFERTKGKNNNSEKKYVQMTETRPSLPLLYR